MQASGALPQLVDLLIVGGEVIDGSGGPRVTGTVGVMDGRLHIGDVGWQPRAARTIDATGLIVAPGFIDLHSHGGLMILADPRHEPKVRQGVTTEIVGVDGNGYAPFAHRADLLDFVRLNAGLDGDPGIDYDWDTVASYLDRYDRGQAINVGIMVGNSALRIGAIGWEDEPADERAVAAMRAMLREAMEEGAFGISSGLDYPPGSYASTDELAALTQEAAQHGGFYHTHVRYPLGDQFLDPFREAIEIGRRGEGPAHITHFYHRQTFPGSPDEMLALVDDARAAGQDVTFDAYPYEWASTRLLIQLPQWVQAGGPMRLKERLAEGTTRDRIRTEMAARGAAYASAAGWADVRLGAFSRPDNLRWESRTLAEVMDDTGQDAVDAICQLLALRGPAGGPGHQRPVDRWPAALPAAPRGDGRHRFHLPGREAVATHLRQLPRASWASSCATRACCRCEEAVRRMTGAPAARLGMRERGLLRDGFAADVAYRRGAGRADDAATTSHHEIPLPMGSSTSS